MLRLYCIVDIVLCWDNSYSKLQTLFVRNLILVWENSWKSLFQNVSWDFHDPDFLVYFLISKKAKHFVNRFNTIFYDDLKLIYIANIHSMFYHETFMFEIKVFTTIKNFSLLQFSTKEKVERKEIEYFKENHLFYFFISFFISLFSIFKKCQSFIIFHHQVARKGKVRISNVFSGLKRVKNL